MVNTRSSGKDKKFNAKPTSQQRKRRINDEANADSQGSTKHEKASTKKCKRCTVNTNCSPFHVDKSSNRSFYSQVNMKPPFSMYAPPYNQMNGHSEKNDSCWTLSLGDTVAIHIMERTAINANQFTEIYPFTVPWSCGEIISMFTSDHGENEKKWRCSDEIKIEVRWFYKLNEISGISKKSFLSNTEVCIEEMLETDKVSEIELSSILSPVQMHISPGEQEASITTNPLQMPEIHYYCHRLWSIHRKSLMPIGADRNRFKRGIMYSKYLGPNGVARVSFEKLNQCGGDMKSYSSKVSSTCTDLSEWREMVQNGIETLSLSQVSVAIEDEGTSLIGREKEQEQITSFLRSAIKGTDKKVQEQANKCSLFIAGPPGVGKTATVRLVISKLRKDQSNGNIPPFKYIHLNGMEMRHPFDAYCRLWEALSPFKEKCAPGEAAARLELYFAGDDSSDEDQNCYNQMDNQEAVVLLIDEMDYLVTKKETVLYNLFDWPTRSGNGSSQLIVIGISNTLNLPERLHPRVQSRLGSERCIYRAYKENDCINIFKNKLPYFESIFREDAIRFAAKKMAAQSGDIRKFFQLAKTALENLLSDVLLGNVCFDGKLLQVCIDDVLKASREMFDTILSKAISCSTPLEALLYISLASMKQKSGREVGGFELKDVLIKMDGIASAFGDEAYLPSPTFQELVDMLNRLSEASIITLLTPNGRNHYGTSGASNTRISLSLDDYEVLNAFRSTYHSKLAEKHLGRSLLF